MGGILPENLPLLNCIRTKITGRPCFAKIRLKNDRTLDVKMFWPMLLHATF